MYSGFGADAYAASMFIAAIVSLLLGARAWSGTRKELSLGFALFDAAIFLWSLFRFLELVLVSGLAQLLALKLQYLGIVLIPGAFLMIARAIAKRPLAMRSLPLVFLPAILMLAFVASHDAHHYVWTGLAPLRLINRGWGDLAFWAFDLYGLVLVTLAFFIIAGVVRRSRGLTARWLRSIMLFFLLPFASNSLFAFLIPSSYDPSPLVFAFSGLCLALTLRHFDILELVPYAKNLILKSIGSPLIVVDAEGVIVGANEEAQRIAGSPGELEGRAIAEVVPSLDAGLADGDTREWSCKGVDYHITCHVVKQAHERWRGHIILFRDVSALLAARREAETARARADEANAAKSALVAVVSHELRNPLNAIIGLAELDLRSEPPPELKSDLQVILGSGTILLGLVNDLLDLSKIEAGRMELERVDFDLHEKAVSMLRAFRPIVEEKGIFLDIAIAEGTPRRVRGDPLRYGQVLMNLVSNAVKFTERGAVTVELAPKQPPLGAQVEPRSVWLLTSVSDTGMGIREEALPLLFREFSQADPSVSRRFGGTGLGLSISKKLVELFGGGIEARSVYGQGSTFSFSARFEPGEEGPGQAEEGRPLRVLIVDDEPINIAVARRQLGKLGHQAFQAESGAAALALASESEFDLVLLDLGLPDMDGFEVCRRLRARTISAGSLPIAAMTARSEPGLRAACAAAGMMGCLSKPLDPAALEKLVSGMALRARELPPHAAALVHQPLAAASRSSSSPSYPALHASPIDGKALLDSLQEDRAFALELLELFVSEAPGRDAAFAAALAEGDIISLRRLSHALRGSSLTLCARPLAQAAAVVESRVAGAQPGAPGAEADLEGMARTVGVLRASLADTVAAAGELMKSLRI